MTLKIKQHPQTYQHIHKTINNIHPRHLEKLAEI